MTQGHCFIPANIKRIDKPVVVPDIEQRYVHAEMRGAEAIVLFGDVQKMIEVIDVSHDCRFMIYDL